MKAHSTITIGAVAVLTAVSLTACGGGGSNTPNTPTPTPANTTAEAAPATTAAASASSQGEFDKAMSTPTSLTFWTWATDMDKEVALFHEKYPAITVDVVNPGQGTALYTKLEAAIQAGTGTPDVSQIEFQYLPTFRLGNNLLDIAPYVGDISGLYPAWIAGQIASDGAIWAIPQDTGPMGMLYRTDLLEKAGIKVPTTYEEFAAAATAFHAANPGAYFTNMPSNEPGHWMGMFWQAGAQPFTYDGKETVSINLTSDAIKKVIDYWQPLIQSGAVATDPDWTDQWYAGLNNGTYATMLTAAWAPMFLQGIATDTSGKWRAAPLPQWDPASPASGNWGGSTVAVLASTKNPIAAAELARFINQDPTCALMQANEQSLFPALTSVLSDPAWVNAKPEFYGGQAVNQVFAQISETVNKDFQWPPFLDYVYSSFNDTLAKAMTDKGDMQAGLAAWQNAVVQYAQQQGFTVK